MGGLQERLKKARKVLRYSQDDVAKYIGINRTAVVELEAGKRKVSTEELKKFCKLYGKTADELLYGTVVTDLDLILLRGFASLDEVDQKEILDYIEFKRIKKEGGLLAYLEKIKPEVE